MNMPVRILSMQQRHDRQMKEERARLISIGSIQPFGSLTGRSAIELQKLGYPQAAKARAIKELGLRLNLSSPYGRVYL